MNPQYRWFTNNTEGSFFVRMEGLEPPRLAAPDPKSGAATNYATSAIPKKERKFIEYLGIKNSF